jgi:hypothetical protein
MENTKTIAWPQVIVLLLLNIFLVISWLIYDNFQPQLLANFNLQDSKPNFDIVHLLVMVLVPILAGNFSDKFFKNSSSKFLLITIGMSITAIIFMATGSLIKINSAGGAPYLSYVFLGLFTIWMVGMNVFNSPANSFLEKYSPASSLPLIVGIYTLLSELTLAFEPKVEQLVLKLGVVTTLLSAGLLLAILGFVFFKINNKTFEASSETEAENKDQSYPKIIAIGLFLGAVVGCVKFYIPTRQSVVLDPFYVLIISAVLAVPIGLFLNNGRLGFIYLMGILFFLLGLLNLTGNIARLNYACFGLSLSALSVSSFPLILKFACKKNLALSVGLFLGCSELTEGIIEIMYQV